MRLTVLVLSSLLIVWSSRANPFFGGATYDESTGSGYRNPIVVGFSSGTVANGFAIGGAHVYVGGKFGGQDALRWDENGVTRLDAPSGWASLAYASNNQGLIVGYMGTSAARWGPSGAVTPLDNLGVSNTGLTTAVAWSINGTGAAVGFAQKYLSGSTRGDRAVYWRGDSATALELGNLGTSQSPSLPGVTNARAFALSDHGMVVGYAQKFSASGLLGTRPVRWDVVSGTTTELGHIGTRPDGFTDGEARFINNSGVVAGQMKKYSGEATIGLRATRWDASSTLAVELGTLGTDPSGYTVTYPSRITASGVIVGGARKYADGVYVGSRAVRWEPSTTVATELDTLGTDANGVTSCLVSDGNDNGWIVGTADRYVNGHLLGRRAAAWTLDGSAIDLNDLLAPSDAEHWILTHAQKISPMNWVTGLGQYDPDGPGSLQVYERAFLMQIPEPASLCMIAWVFGATLHYRRANRL